VIPPFELRKIDEGNDSLEIVPLSDGISHNLEQLNSGEREGELEFPASKIKLPRLAEFDALSVAIYYRLHASSLSEFYRMLWIPSGFRYP